MPWWMETDTFADDQMWDVLGGGDPTVIDRLQALHCRLRAVASHQTSDGWLTEQTALRYARGRRQLLDRLAMAVLDQPPKLHREGDKCDCLGDTWIAGYAYRIHQFLRRNPSRTEYQRHRAQKADLRDPRLKAAVLARDGGCCRYCRSGPLSAKAGRARDRRRALTYDHPDPDAPAGVGGANLVVCCARCNEVKGHRTPDEADMVLLPEPTQAERMAWSARSQPVLRDLPDRNQNQKQITDESPTNHQHDVDPIGDRSLIPVGDPNPHPIDDSTGPVRPEQDDRETDDGRFRSGKGAGQGRGAADVVDSPAGPGGQPARAPVAPDVYHRRSRPPSPGQAPPYVWPPGAVPVEPRRAGEQDHEGEAEDGSGG